MLRTTIAFRGPQLVGWEHRPPSTMTTLAAMLSFSWAQKADGGPSHLVTGRYFGACSWTVFSVVWNIVVVLCGIL